jgi:NADP-dependent 3-hydroxy acid dehydrogenase YdfG
MVIVVTGASAGVGRATVRAFARAGADVGLIARGVQALAATKREVEQLGRRAVVAPADVAEPRQIEDAAELIERELGSAADVRCTTTAFSAPRSGGSAA